MIKSMIRDYVRSMIRPMIGDIVGGDTSSYIITIDTTKTGTTASNQYRLPVFGTYDVDWGDGNSSIGVVDPQIHTYSSGGTYQITVSNTFNYVRHLASGNDPAKMVSIDQWGSAQITNLNQAYLNCVNMDILASDIPNTSNVTSMFFSWQNCSSLTSFPLIDTSNVTSMTSTWQNCSSLTSFPLIDTSNVENSSLTFFGCTGLTSLPLIDLSSMTFASNMFGGCTLNTTDWSNLLIQTETLNHNNSVTWSGGNSLHNAAGQTAINDLVANHGWVITDGGLEP